MLNSCSDPLACTQETAAYLKKFRASQLRCAPGYRHNDITVLIIGNPNTAIKVVERHIIGFFIVGSPQYLAVDYDLHAKECIASSVINSWTKERSSPRARTPDNESRPPAFSINLAIHNASSIATVERSKLGGNGISRRLINIDTSWEANQLVTNYTHGEFNRELRVDVAHQVRKLVWQHLLTQL